MNLGAFSVALTVKDIKKSYEFYQKLGFEHVMGKQEDGWLIMKNKDHVIGLFQGMFDQNILTFNPGWDQNAQELKDFTDVREIQKALKAKGIKFESEADESSTGPASFSIKDPDGNLILVDQHR